jgi:hypothetical protein
MTAWRRGGVGQLNRRTLRVSKCCWMSIGLGDDALATGRSLSAARRRAVRIDRVKSVPAQ